MFTSSPRPSRATTGRGVPARDLHPADIAPVAARFMAGRDASSPDECWIWRGNKADSSSGYAKIWISKPIGRHFVHRVAWVLSTGSSLTNNLVIDHLCRTRLCVNPSHLEPVTSVENVRRGRIRLREDGVYKSREQLVAEGIERKRQWRINNPEKAKVENSRPSRPRACRVCGLVTPAGSATYHRRRAHPEAD